MDGEHKQYLLPFPKATISYQDAMGSIKLPPANAEWRCLFEGKSPSENKRVLNMVVVGMTGAGKTTWINGFVNHILGIKKNVPWRYVIADEQKIINERIQDLRR